MSIFFSLSLMDNYLQYNCSELSLLECPTLLDDRMRILDSLKGHSTSMSRGRTVP